jgi:hypothetical protein
MIFLFILIGHAEINLFYSLEIIFWTSATSLIGTSNVCMMTIDSWIRIHCVLFFSHHKFTSLGTINVWRLLAVSFWNNDNGRKQGLNSEELQCTSCFIHYIFIIVRMKLLLFYWIDDISLITFSSFLILE